MAEKLARVSAVTELAPQVLLVTLQPVSPPALGQRPGQFISLRFDRKGDIRRSYSVATHPSRPERVELVVKLLPGGLASEVFEAMRPGDEVHFTGPMGFFVPLAAHEGDVLFAVTGAGIAAALPILEEILARERETGRVTLFWGLRRGEDLYFRERLAALPQARFEAHLSLTQPPPGWTGMTGRITPHVVAAIAAAREPCVYAVGHGEMVADVRKAFLDAGHHRKRFVGEIFYPAGS